MSNAIPHYPYCPICRKRMRKAFTARVFNKYDVNYFYSDESGIIQTEIPYWNEEVSESPISDLDTGILSRNFDNRNRIAPILYNLFGSEGHFLDIGGGYGTFTRLMRDIGFDFYSTDISCKNIFAEYFQPQLHATFDCLTAIEILEHLYDPVDFISNQLTVYLSNSFLFTTLTFEGAIPDKSWWYYTFESGQHITFYQSRSLAMLANTLKLNYYQLSVDLHLFTDIKVHPKALFFLKSRLLKKLYLPYVLYRGRKKTRIWSDREIIKENLKF